jgi:Protein of unknown function (DUF1592)/Protein of unknown function (DUF1588)/Protein of unknown function (DUF1595)/Protein of unknown function (DUF1587)/Protein of unknown function (DUF1585)
MRNLVGLGLALALGSGCYAGVGSFDGADGGPDGTPGDDGADDDGADDDGDPVSQCGGDPAPGKSPIRRLSAWEYENTMADLLGDDSHPAAGFPQEGGSGFDNNADVAGVTRLMADKYMQASEEIAARAVADLGTLLPCDPAAVSEGADEHACIEQWIDGFGLRAWRRPLTAEERTGMLALYDEVRATDDLPTATGLVLQAFLQSPHFLYRVELGVPGEQGTAAVRLGDYEMASRLSYFLWGSMPDQALLDAAAAGGLTTPEDVEAQARRMLDDPKTRRVVEHFNEQWLGTLRLLTLEKDTTVFPEWSPELSAKQMQEAAAFVDHVYFEGEGTLSELLTAPYTFVDAELAAHYGLPAPAGAGLHKTDAAAGIELSGILSLGGVLSAYSLADTTDPIKRGLFVREHLLCQIPPPPPDVIPELPPIDPNATTRERFEQHRSDPVCAACHTLFDPIGFGFENYDAVGRWRTTENGQPVDASGELTAADVAGEFVGVRELGGKLAGSEDVAACMTRQWFRFAYGRTESEELDACNMETLTTMFAESDHDLRELLVALTQTDAFLFRTAYADEGGN